MAQRFRTVQTEDMMHRLLQRSIAVAAISVVLPAAAAAQIRLSVAAGPSLPIGDLADDFERGWHAQASAALSAPLLPIALRVDGAYNRFAGTVGGHFQTISGSINAFLSLPSVLLTPYVIGGVGVYSSRDEGGTVVVEETNVGGNIGVGLRVGLPFFSVFGEARVHTIFSESPRVAFAPLSVGLHF